MPVRTTRRSSGPAPSPPRKRDRFAVAPEEGLSQALQAAQAGNEKLRQAVEIMRVALETIVVAEYDHQERRETTARDLRKMATNGLNEYSRLTGQNWRTEKLRGSLAGDRSLDGQDAEG